MRIHLNNIAGDREVYTCPTMGECELDGKHPGCTLVGWIDRGRVIHNGKVEWCFTPTGSAPRGAVHVGNYAAAVDDARTYVRGLLV